MNKLISSESENEDLIVMFSWPFCCWKSTIIKYLRDNYNFNHIINTTTRQKRPWEIDWVDYNFIEWPTNKDIEIDCFSKQYYLDKFIVASEFKWHFYWVPKIENINWLLCNDILSDYVKFLKRHYWDKVLSIFLSPPENPIELQKRAEKRWDNQEDIVSRIKLGELERPENCDIVIPSLPLSIVINEVVKVIANRLYS
jgi:guanylate kinase